MIKVMIMSALVMVCSVRLVSCFAITTTVSSAITSTLTGIMFSATRTSQWYWCSAYSCLPCCATLIIIDIIDVFKLMYPLLSPIGGE